MEPAERTLTQTKAAAWQTRGVLGAASVRDGMN